MQPVNDLVAELKQTINQINQVQLDSLQLDTHLREHRNEPQSDCQFCEAYQHEMDSRLGHYLETRKRGRK